ncbi:MAG: hypothetical protein COA43_07900 [Robiginitomaculum sp.]|nr:MAG: hypothetical protein COA43_07900 [Robiginitomaculum sp.]
MTKFMTVLLSATTLALFASPAMAADSPTLRIENFIGTLDLVNSTGSKISVQDADGASIDVHGDGVTIDDGVEIKNTHCKSSKSNIKIGMGSWKVLKRSGGYKDLNTYPKLKITAPENTHLIITNSVIFGDVENLGSAEIHIRSCGDLEIGDVAGEVGLYISGSGDLDIGDTGPATIRISGSGDVEAGDFVSADIRVSGSGDLDAGDIAGFVRIASSGAGDIELEHLGNGLEYSGSGASDLRIKSVSGGDLIIHASGSGDVDIKKGSVDKLDIRASGASDVRYGGTSNSAEARASGASDVYMHAPSGHLHTSDSGAGDVHVKGR